MTEFFVRPVATVVTDLDMYDNEVYDYGDLCNVYEQGRKHAVNDAADAKRMRWLLNGNGYFMEEEGLCGCKEASTQDDQEYARKCIDEAMAEANCYD
jgi:hypothetical protein